MPQAWQNRVWISNLLDLSPGHYLLSNMIEKQTLFCPFVNHPKSCQWKYGICPCEVRCNYLLIVPQENGSHVAHLSQ